VNLKPANEIVTILDSRGNPMRFWRKAEEDGTPTPEVEILTFEEFLAEAQETQEESKYVDGRFELGRGKMTFAPETVKQYRKAYDEEVRRIVMKH